jgi:hypothetical protein
VAERERAAEDTGVPREIMGECPSCNAPLRDGAWTCGKCGAPVAGAGMATAPDAGDYGDSPGAPVDAYGTPPAWSRDYQAAPPADAPTSAGSSGLLKLVLVVAVVAVIAVVLVWFFVLRGPATTGEEFLGTWTATTQKGIATAVIAQKHDAFTVTLSGNRASQKVTIPAHLDGAELVITMDDFSQIAGEANAEQFKATLKALAGDFKLVFRSADATHLDLSIVGKSPSGQAIDETIPLVKDAAGTT